MTRQLSWWTLAAVLAVSVAGFSFAALADDEDENETEQGVSLKNVPESVKATILMQILRECDDVEIEGIEREAEGDATVYEATIEIDDKLVELEIAADGRLLEKEVAIEDDDDGDDEEDSADDEDDEDEDEEDDGGTRDR